MVTGYAFDVPNVLAAQRVWGIVHATTLLARACAGIGDVAAVEAWFHWQESQDEEIRHAAVLLARHHFSADTAARSALSEVLGLPQRLAMSDDALHEACATLPAALASGRYDLARRRQEWSVSP